MKKRNIIGLGLLILGVKIIVFSVGYISITGNIISETMQNNSSIFSIVGISFILGALIMFANPRKN